MVRPYKQTVTKYNYKKQKLLNNKQLNISHLVPNSLLGGIQLLSHDNKNRDTRDREDKK
jgi:hypothetical protein